MHGSLAIHHHDPEGDRSRKAPSSSGEMAGRNIAAPLVRLGRCQGAPAQTRGCSAGEWLRRDKPSTQEGRQCTGKAGAIRGRGAPGEHPAGKEAATGGGSRRRPAGSIKADSTRRSSQAVPHPSTNRALCRLTSEVRRDPVFAATVWPSAKALRAFTII